ncbi:hypothetical protein JBE27_02705 [Streptomyces albiflaviniger]|nr:hypothetical protein [Streptomyces albiflaviniger]
MPASVACALHLDDDERDYLFALARPAKPQRRRTPRAERTRSAVHRMLDGTAL